MGSRRTLLQPALLLFAVLVASPAGMRAQEAAPAKPGVRPPAANPGASQERYILARRRELAIREELMRLPVDAPTEKVAALRARLLEAKKKRVAAFQSRNIATSGSGPSALELDEESGGFHPVWYAVLVIAAGIGAIAYLSRRGESVIPVVDSGTESPASRTTGVTGAAFLRASAGPLLLTLMAFLVFVFAGKAVGLALPLASAMALGLVATLAILGRGFVADYVQGKLFAAEPPFRTGDIVGLSCRSGDELEGCVEGITTRTTVLRDFDGSLHHVPHSRIAAVQNCTSAWTDSITDVHISYSADVDEVVEVLRRAAEDARVDPSVGKLISTEGESITIDCYESYGAILRLRLKTRPLRKDQVSATVERTVVERCRIASIEAKVRAPESSLDA